MRLIDADELIERLETRLQYHKDHSELEGTELCYYARAIAIILESVIEDVKEAPTIEERKTGK